MASPSGQVEQIPFTAAPRGAARRTGKRSYAVPLVVAVTGHRDLLPAEIPLIRTRVREFLASLRDAYPDRVVAVMSPLAEGADRLAAEEAITLGMPLTVPLPMPKEIYASDFATPQSKAHFEQLCAAAADVFELPLTPGNSRGVDPRASARTARASMRRPACFSARTATCCWRSGTASRRGQLGGTSQVVRFHHHDVMPGYTPRATSSRLTLTDDESDLVYHIVCSRNRPDGAPAEGLVPLEASWFTTDEQHPRVREMPLRHKQVFERANEFSQDAQANAEAIDRERYPLLTDEQAAVLPPGLQDINQVFCAADWLAIRFQKRVTFTLRATHVGALLTGLAYISYTDIESTRALILVILSVMLATVGIGYLANRGSWHRKYLDYRTLAEGLRVQFYWAAAGVTSGNVTKFAHDNFLQMQDPDLGWIRNVMRVAGTECDVAPNRDPASLEFVLREWIGDAGTGQLGYYRRKGAERLARHMTTERIGRLGLLATGNGSRRAAVRRLRHSRRGGQAGRVHHGLRAADGRRAPVLCQEHCGERADQAV